MFNLTDKIQSGIVNRLLELKGDAILRSNYPHYTRDVDDNLIPGVRRADFWDDLERANGSELQDTADRPPKFCAAHSSSALAVNSFGPFRHAPQRLSLAGETGYSKAEFEFKCPTGLGGTPPNLDFYAESPNKVVAVESKFTEPLTHKPARFADSYNRAVANLADPMWQQVYKTLKDNPYRFKHLDAAQLVKHYLGVRHHLEHLDTVKMLLYIFWEPVNSDEILEFRLHRDEIAKFSRWVAGSNVQFLAISYLELWDGWVRETHWDGMRLHVQNLNDRYKFVI